MAYGEDDILINLLIRKDYLDANFFNRFSDLSNYIKKHTGKTYKELIQNQRLQFAATLLSNTALPVTEVSQQCSYENVSFFYKKFSERFHCSPGEYRRRF